MFMTTEVPHVLYWIDMGITKQQNLKFCLEK